MGRPPFASRSDSQRLERLHPFAGDELVSGLGGMHAVPQPVVGRGQAAGLVELFLQGNEGATVLFGHAAGGLRAQGHLAGEGLIAIRPFGHGDGGAAGQHEGLQDDELHTGQRLVKLREQPVVHPLELGRAHAVRVQRDAVPHVVYADEQAQTVRREVDDVALHAGVDVHHAVAADAPVDAIVSAGPVVAQSGLDEQRVAEAHRAPAVRVDAVASHVGDGIALEEYLFHGGSVSFCIIVS